MVTLKMPVRALYIFSFICAFSALPLFSMERPTDAAIVNNIHRALFEDLRVRSSDITVKSIDGIVTLDGAVKTIAEMQYADLEAKKINGVLGVINKLTVKPTYRLDAEIRQDLRHKIVRSSVIKSQNIGVRVENGVVFLTGSVASLAESDQVYLLAAEVRGVKAIENHLEVNFGLKRPDTEIRKDVLTKLKNDVYLVGLPVTVSVKNGSVTLSGEVGNVFEKERAEKDAANLFNVLGVKNDLKVSWARAQAVRNEGRGLPDSTLSAVLSEEISLDTRLDEPNHIQIQVQKGMITLTGDVPTYVQKRVAGQDVKEIAGDHWINNFIQVKGVIRDDFGIFMDIRDALASDYELTGNKVSYNVIDGVVTLKGNVNSDYEKKRFEKDVEGIIGVKDIADYIVVDWLPSYTDEALKGRIFDRLAANWVTWPLLNKIAIDVNHGKATLSGTVNSRSQYIEAENIAGQTDGVFSVDNKLVIQGN